MILGAIDGHSRTVLYLKCHNNNTETALFEFTQAVNGYGVPSRVRTDKRGKNRGIAWFMLNHPERAQEEETLLLAVVYTIEDKKDYGVMSTMVVHMFSIHSFITWKNRVFLIQQMNYTFSAFIMCLFPEQTIIF